MDQVFGQLAGMQMEPDLSYIDDSKEILNEISMDLDDFKFDFDCLSDGLGPWIQAADEDSTSSSGSTASGDGMGLGIHSSQLDLGLMSDVEDDYDLKSETTDFEDLNITEAVRYDCMWSSHAPSAAHIAGPPARRAHQPASVPLCENTLFEEFLKIIDIPSQFDLAGEDLRQQADEQKSAREERRPLLEDDSKCDKSEQEKQARLLTSLDHCYVSTSLLPRTDSQARRSGGSYSSSGYSSDGFPATPPESSEDEDCLQNCTPFPHVINPGPTSSSACSNTNSKNTSSTTTMTSLTCNRSQSLLKKSRLLSATGGEAKFSFRCKFKPEKSRSLLKQKLRLSTSSTSRNSATCCNSNDNNTSCSSCGTSSNSYANSSRFAASANRHQQQSTGLHHRLASTTGLSTSVGGNSSSKNQVHASIRRRKEESLKAKHHEARQIHNHMERQRRNELKAAFDELKGCIPEIAATEKVSKQMILDTALRNCKQIKSRQLGMKLRRDKLKKSNAELRDKLKKLQMALSSSSSSSRQLDG